MVSVVDLQCMLRTQGKLVMSVHWNEWKHKYELQARLHTVPLHLLSVADQDAVSLHFGQGVLREALHCCRALVLVALAGGAEQEGVRASWGVWDLGLT